jgi:hypothetical protein
MRYSLLAPWLVLVLYGCGSGVVCFGGSDCGGNNDNDERTVTVAGNLDSVRPPNSVRDVVVFVYTNLDPADLADGPPFTEFKFAESAVVADDDTFEITRVGRGKLTVILLLDDPDPDGSIDSCDDLIQCAECDAGTCDEYSVLRDGGDLSDVPGGRRVTIDNMDVDFDGSCPDPAPAAGCGCTTADDIVISRDNNGGGSSNSDGN